MKVLVVGDGPESGARVRLALRGEPYRVVAVARDADAVARARAERPAAIVLDSAVTEDGADLSASLHRETGAPVLVLISRDGANAWRPIVQNGTVDYLIAPFAPSELGASLRALLHRSSRAGAEPLPQSFGHLTVDPEASLVMLDGAPLPLRAQEVSLLGAFLRRPAEVLSREQLLALAWGYAFAGRTRTVDVHVNTLRGKIAGSGLRIETVRGAGYRLVIEPVQASHPHPGKAPKNSSKAPK